MDPAAKKSALRAITYGLYVLTADAGDHFGAATVNWLTQASFEPPLVVAGVKADSDTHTAVERTGGFAVSVLSEEQLHVAKAFFRPAHMEGTLLSGYAFERSPVVGAPVLMDAPWWFEARVTDTVARGDHTVYVGEVVGAGVRNEDAMPLNLRVTGMFYGG